MTDNRIERHVVLVSPQVHWNTGNIGRTCIGAGAFLHLIKPLGFSLMIDYKGDDTYGRRLTKNPTRKGYPRDVFGGVWASNKPSAWPYGICLDLGGKDIYNIRI